MPRQSRSRPAARPAAPPPPQKTQTRSASTTAAPPVPAQAPPAPVPHPGAAAAPTSSGPGMIAQMAATAGSVAIGSTIGHGLSSMLFGGSRAAEPVEQPAAAAPVQQQTQAMSCDNQAKEFTKCLETSDVNGCSWYLEQLKACQAAARPY